MANSPKRLLLVGSTKSDVHLRNYYALIEGTFDEVLLVSGNSVEFCETKILDFGLKNPLTVMKSIRQLRKIIEAFEPTVIHVHQANTFGYITAKANQGKIPLILTIWGSDVLLLPKKSPIHRHIVKTALKGADRITADASFIQNNVTELIGKSHFTTANFGIDLPEITVDLEKKESLIYSNRLHNDLYNIDAIIEGFSTFVKSHQNWKLVIAGRGPNTEQLKSLAESLLPKESYEFVGFVDYDTNMNFYSKAAIYASIPSSDGTSVSLLEAMACGAIPVVSDLPANHEWIDSGSNGIIVQNGLDVAFNKALELNSADVVAKNKNLIEEKATKKANRAIFLNLYKELSED